MICLAVSVPLQIYVRNAKTGKEAWDSLSNRFEEKTLSRKILMRRKLYHARMDSSNMMDHINNIRTIADQLEGLGDQVAENDLVMVLLSSLPDEYNNLITTLETLEESRLTWEYVRDRLLTEYERRPVKHSDINEALLTSGLESLNVGSRGGTSENGREFKCHYCKAKGHLKRDCPEKRANDSAREERDRVEQRESASYCNCCKDETPVSFLSTTSEEFVPEIALHVEMDGGNGSQTNKWYLDSACSHHMTGDESVLCNYKEFSRCNPRYVKLADKSRVRALGQGDMNVHLKDDTGKRVPVVFTDIMFVPKLETSLISIGTLANRGLVMFGKKYVKLGMRGRNVRLGIRRGQNMFEMQCDVVP